MTEYQPWERNELNKNSQGGSEMMCEGMLSRLSPALKEKIQIIPSRVRELRADKLRIYWLHDLPWDPQLAHLREEASRNRFHKIVFCGQWQKSMFETVLGIPHDQRTAVIDTAIVPFTSDESHWKHWDGQEIRMIYTSTPQRGLELLVPAFIDLCKDPAMKQYNLVLDVFSSFEIYGWPQADEQHKALFETCRTHPQIRYHGFQPNDVVREAVRNAHIFAYPSIWMECNSRALIEAMSAGLICVHPDLAGLADTSGSLTRMYHWDKDPENHKFIFKQVLFDAVMDIKSDRWVSETDRPLQIDYANRRYNWTTVMPIWHNVINNGLMEYDGQLTLPPEPKKKFTYDMTPRM